MRIIYHSEFVANVLRAPNGDVHLQLVEDDRSESHVFPMGPEAATEVGEKLKLKASGIEVVEREVPHGDESGPVAG